jgi:hypothetical protein
MTHCIFCGIPTKLLVNRTPVCRVCDTKHDKDNEKAEPQGKKPLIIVPIRAPDTIILDAI